MTKARKRIIVALAAVMAVLTAVAFLLFSPGEIAFAERSSTAWTTIGEIYNDSTKGFNEDNLKKLYKALTGTGTFASVQSAASGNKTSADFRMQNVGSNNVSVWFGGKKWDAVYLTKATNGDVILDLWQSADNINKQKVGFLDWDAERTDVNDTYPANMYSTSKLRVETLNAGGYCLTSKDKLGTKQEQDSNNQYARFTMSTVANSLTKYIATPAEVGYQEHEFDGNTAADIGNQVYKSETKYYLPNDAYGTPSDGGVWFDADYGNLYNSKDGSRVDEAKYGAWKDDYLWIPSITEAGCSATGTGLWKTDFSLRSSAGTQGTDWTWFRSGYSSDEKYSNTDYYFFVFVIGVLDEDNNHADWSNLTSTDPNFVRPALHLNLTAANGNVKSEWKNIGEIYQDSSNSFNAANVKALYSALTGDDGKYSSLKEATRDNNVLTSSDFRGFNDGQNVQVTFGGIKWDVVYLTRDKNDNVILDLWQSVDSITLTREWASRNNALNNLEHLYPDNMYSSSTIRVIALNAGGNWASDNDAITPAPQQSSSPYARFTMDSGIANSLTNYIVKPADVSYQETEFDSATAKAYCGTDNYLPNDAYGTPTGGQWAIDSSTQISYDYSDRPGYDAWKNDYLWLPSITEAGCNSSGTGLWKTDAALRNSGGVAVWTRSGDDNWAANAYALEPTGNNQHYYVNYSYAVRPAIHLNLTAIKNAITTPIETPEISSKTYTGHPLTASISTKLGFAIVSNDGGTEVGTYDVVLELTDEDKYRWQDSDELQIKLTFDITTAKNEWTNDGIIIPNDGEGWTYGDTIEHTPLEPTAPAKFDSVNNERATMTYYNDKDGEPDTSSPLEEFPINAGTYWVKATVPARQSKKDTSKKNYNELVSDPVRFEIKAATLTVLSADVTEKIYDGKDNNPDISFTFGGYKKTEDEGAISVAEYEAKYASADAGDSVTVTVTEIILGGSAAGNYTVDLKNLPAISGNINKAALKITLSTDGKTYDGSDIAAVTGSIGSDSGKVDGDDVKIAEIVATYEDKNAAENKTITIKSLTLGGTKAGNYDAEYSKTLTATISPLEVDVTFSPNSQTYSGEVLIPVVTSDKITVESDITQSLKEEVTESTFTFISDKVNAGTYGLGSDITVDIGNSNFTLGTVGGTFEIERATANVNWYADYGTKNTDITNESNIVYDGAKHTVTLKLSVGSYSVTITPDVDFYKNADSYTFIAEDKSGNFTKSSWTLNLTVDKATLAVLSATVKDKTYDGEKNNPDISFTFDGYKGSDDNEDAVNVLSYAAAYESADAGDSVAVTVTQITLGGTAADNYTVELGKFSAITGKIEKATLVLRLTAVGKIYDGNNVATVTGEISDGKVGTDDVKIAAIAAQFDSADVGVGKIINVTKITLDGTKAGNYTVDIATLPRIEANIDPKTVNVVWSGYLGLVYDGSPKTITAKATGVEIDGIEEEIVLIIKYESDTPGVVLVADMPQNAGTYTATATTSNGNYNLAENEITYTVAKKPVAVPTVDSKVYDGTKQTSGISDTDDYTVEEEGGIIVSEYPVTLTLRHPENYKWTNSEETDIVLMFAIIKATYDMNGVSFENFTVIYDAQEHSIFIDGTLPNDVSVRYEGNGQKAIGVHTVTAIFTGDEINYNAIDNKTALLTILPVSHNLNEITFKDVTVKYDGEAHSIYIEGTLPTNVTVAYEGNGQTEPNIYTVTAVFRDPDGVVFADKTATLTILRTQTQTAPPAEDGSGSDELSDVLIESDDGFDPTLELVVEKIEDVARNYWAWGNDEVSEKYAVKMCKDGIEVPIDGKVTVRLLIPEAFGDKDFELKTVARAASIEYTRDGDYVVFETDGLSTYVFTSVYTPYFPIIIIATGVLLADVLAMIVLTVIIMKKRSAKVR